MQNTYEIINNPKLNNANTSHSYNENELISNLDSLSLSEQIATLKKNSKIQQDTINTLKQEKQFEEFKANILQEEYIKLQNNYNIIFEANKKNLTNIDKLNLEIKELKESKFNEKKEIKKIKGK